MGSIWATVPGFSMYEASTEGHVRRKSTGHVLSERDSKGYLKVNVVDDEGRHRTIDVHRLVAAAFLENDNGYEQVNHKDECKTNNAPTNLEWCTCEYNLAYGVGRLCPWRKQVEQLYDGKVVAVHDSIGAAARAVGAKPSKISRVCHGERRSCRGFGFRFAL